MGECGMRSEAASAGTTPTGDGPRPFFATGASSSRVGAEEDVTARLDLR